MAGKKISSADRRRIARARAMANARKRNIPAKRASRQSVAPAKRRTADYEKRMRIRALRKRAQELEDEIEDAPVEDEDAPEVEARRRAARRRALAKRRAAQRRRVAAPKRMRRRAQEEPVKDDVEETVDELEGREELEARRARARRAAIAKRRAAQRRAKMTRRAQDDEDIPADIEPEEEPVEVVEDEEVEARRARARRARALRKARRAMRKRATDGISDDLTGPADDGAVTIPQGKDVSDDLTDPDEGDGGIQQTPAELPDSIDEAEDKVIAAYNLIEAQIAAKVVPANVKKAQLASKYARKYTAREMKLAASQLAKASSPKKVEKGVRVSKRSSVPYTKTAKSGSMDDFCLFG